MLLLPLLIAISAGAHAQVLNITYFSVPAVVGPKEDFAELECRYQANKFTTFGFWRGSREFFRFQPIASPSIRVFELCGAESVEVIYCGYEGCKIRIGGMSSNASGQYKCDLETNLPPLINERKMAYMEVQRTTIFQPMVEALAPLYQNGDILYARCTAEAMVEIRWYINGHEHMEFRDERIMKKPVYPGLRKSLPRTLVVQCAMYKHGRVYFSEPRTTRWIEDPAYKFEKALDQNKGVIEVLYKDRVKIEAPHKGVVEMKAPHKKIIDVVGENNVSLIILCNKGSPVATGFVGTLSTLLNFLSKLVVI